VFTHDDIMRATMARASGSVIHVTGVSTDSRSVKAGELFVALRGELFDGHMFAGDAVRRGAAAIVSERALDVAVPQYLVDDTLAAYHALAKYHRGRFAMPVIGITGTNGKTTVKELVAALLARVGTPLRSEGNFNNHVGVPLTLLQLHDEHTHAVIEMGMNHPGEIHVLTTLVMPSVAVITNIGRGHLEHLHTLENILAAKLEILDGLVPGGTVVVPRDSSYFEQMRRAAEALNARVVSFGTSPQADVSFAPRHVDANGTLGVLQCGGETREMRVPLPGAHNACNTAAALAAVRAVEPAFPLSTAAETLADFAPVSMRCQLEHVQGMDVLVDCYNANPESVLAALHLLAAHAAGGRRIAILGEMHELGAASAQCHCDVGIAAARTGVSELLALGAHAADIAAGAREAGMPQEHIHLALDAEHAVQVLDRVAKQGDCILLKGSRLARMEDILEKMRRTLFCAVS